MDDLTLVGVHEDGEHIVVSGPGGRQYQLRVNEALRAAVRRDRPRLGQLQIETAGTVRPRDIQARVRAGHTAEEIAETSGVSLEMVRRFEGPILAEREYVAQQARAATIRRHTGAGPTTLAAAVAVSLTAADISGDLAWDSYKAEDGTWIVTLVYPGTEGPGRARWRYDTANRHVDPMDDAARILSGAAPEAADSTVVRRLTPVQPEMEPPSAWMDLPGTNGSGADLLDTLRERRGRRSRPLELDDDPGHTDPRQEALDALIERPSPEGSGSHPAGRGSRTASRNRASESSAKPANRPAGVPTPSTPAGAPGQSPAANVPPAQPAAQVPGAQVPGAQVPGAQLPGAQGSSSPVPDAAGPATGSLPTRPPGHTSDADELATAAAERAERAERADRRAGRRANRDAPRRPTRSARPDIPSVLPVVPEPAQAEPDVVVLPEDDSAQAQSAAANRKRGRASVPSWDDIVFGARRD